MSNDLDLDGLDKDPFTRRLIGNLRREFESPSHLVDDFSKWEYQIGVENLEGKKLTESMLRKWSKDPSRRLECIFCGETYPVNTRFCGRCGEYTGLQPYMGDWSDWR